MGRKILVLDDDAEILEVIRYVLTEQGYEVATLNGGEDIFYQIGYFKPDLVLMDIMLGDMDGRLLCSEIKHDKETRDLPVILISASHDLTHAQCDGAPNDFIAKPFDIYDLVKKVDRQMPH